MQRDLLRKTKFQITFEDVKSCPGSCSGCVLSPEQRAGRTPSMSEDIFDMSLNRISEYLLENRFKSIEMIFVIGDHLYLGTPYIERLYKKGWNEVANKLENPESSFILSTSIYNRYENIKNQMLEIFKFQKEEFPIHLNAVIDLKNYFENKSLWNEQMLFVSNAYRDTKISTEISVSLSDDIAENINSEAAISSLLSSLSKGGHKEFVINWLPSLNNYAHTLNRIESIKVLFEKIVNMAYQNNIRVDALEAIRNRNKYINGNFRDVLRSNLEQYIYIDSEGYLIPKFEIIGDGAEISEIGFSREHHVNDNTFIEYMDDKTKEVVKNSIKSLNKKSCQECDYRNKCLISGYYIYDNLFNNKKTEVKNENLCPHLGFTAFKLSEAHN